MRLRFRWSLFTGRQSQFLPKYSFVLLMQGEKKGLEVLHIQLMYPYINKLVMGIQDMDGSQNNEI